MLFKNVFLCGFVSTYVAPNCTGNENSSNDLISTRNEAFLLVPLLFYGITVFFITGLPVMVIITVRTTGFVIVTGVVTGLEML
jgi:hypothetical protein